MDRKLIDQLQEKYPQIFQDLWGDMRTTCMAWGVATGDGWYNLIDKLCADIMALDPGPNFKAEQIKEKFGGLRFYVSGYPEDETKSRAIGKLISDAEAESYKICETCSSRENITVEGSWIQTLCADCRGAKTEFEAKRIAEANAAYEARKKKKEKGV